MKASQFITGSQFLKRDEVIAAGKIEAMITDVEEVQSFGKRSMQLCLKQSNGQKKKLTLNNSNGGTLAGALGDETDNWVGRRVVVFFDENVEFGKEKVGGIRVRVVQQEAAKPATADEANLPAVLGGTDDDEDFGI